ncbi:TPA: M3 family oligoendopeptidase [Staphylococcus aureus]
MSQGLPLREDVPVSETWDLVDLFKDDQQYYESIDALVQQANQFHHTYATTLNSIEQINTALAELENILIALDRLSNYAELRLSVDTSNIEAQVLSAKLSTTYGKIVSQLSFVESEILELPEEILQQLEESCPYQHYIKQLIKQKPFQLSASVEQVLATLSPTLNSPYDLYGTTKMLDITFDSFEHDGTTYPVDYATFENDYEDNKDPEFRRKSFKSFSDGIRKYQHTTAATYNMQVQQEKIEADLRGFESVIDYLLHSQEVTRDMFDRQIDMIMRDLAPVMQKYAKLLQRIHGLDNMRFEDLKISVDPDYEPEISIEDSKNYIFGALSVLGDDYTNMLREAYDHAGHFTLAQKHQPYLESEASMYFVEAPSTMNEMLMANYLFNTSDNPRFKRWVIGSILSRTYYHNMVTHLLEAAYQREVYHKVDQGESLNAPTLNEIMLNVYKQFFGDAVDMTEGAELTWMRQPHYYMGLYSYTYSAGLTIGTVVSQKIKNEGQPAVDAWLETLKKGGSVSPVELANIAGVDITTEQPLKSTIQYISDLVDEVEKLTDEIEQANN